MEKPAKPSANPAAWKTCKQKTADRPAYPRWRRAPTGVPAWWRRRTWPCPAGPGFFFGGYCATLCKPGSIGCKRRRRAWKGGVFKQGGVFNKEPDASAEGGREKKACLSKEQARGGLEGTGGGGWGSRGHPGNAGHQRTREQCTCCCAFATNRARSPGPFLPSPGCTGEKRARFALFQGASCRQREGGYVRRVHNRQTYRCLADALKRQLARRRGVHHHLLPNHRGQVGSLGDVLRRVVRRRVAWTLFGEQKTLRWVSHMQGELVDNKKMNCALVDIETSVCVFSVAANDIRPRYF